MRTHQSITFGLVFILCSSLGIGQPKISLSTPEVNLGTFYSGDVCKGEFSIRNIGNDTLRIFSVQPQCGCTTVKQPKAALAPNEKDIVEMEFHSSGYFGKVEKHVVISSNDGTSPSVTVTLIGEAKEELEPQNRNIWLGEISVNDTISKNLTYKNVSDKPLTVNNVISSTPMMQIHWEKKTLAPGEVYSIAITMKPPKKGFGTEYLWIETNGRHQPRVETRLPYIGIVK